MNLGDVIEGVIEEYGLPRDFVASAVCDSIAAAYSKKYPNVAIEILLNKKTGELEVLASKLVVTSVQDDEKEVSLRKAKTICPKASLGEVIKVPFEGAIGRVEILNAKQLIAGKIRDYESQAIYNDFKEKRGTVLSGIVHKRERKGYVVKFGETLAFLPRENTIAKEELRGGQPLKVLVSDVLASVGRDGHQIILDRASGDFVKKLIELEIPEVFEGIVEIRKVVRAPGYKTKVLVASSSKDIDPVGTCVGVGGSRVKPILKELGQEKIDFVGWSESLERLVEQSLKPAEIDKVEAMQDGKVVVWLAQDQRAYAIGKMGQNIALAAKLVGADIQLQDLANGKKIVDFGDDQNIERGM